MGGGRKIENADGRVLVFHSQLANSGRNHRHWTAERHPKVDSFLQVPQSLAGPTPD
jgi:hypothetical protein